MRGKSGKEMRNLMLAVSLSVLVLVLAIIAYFMIDTIVTTNNNIEKNKQLVIDQSIKSMTEIGESIEYMVSSPTVVGLFNQETVQKILGGDWQELYKFAKDFGISFFPITYIGIIQNGELVSYGTETGVEVDSQEMPMEPPEGEYGTLYSLGGEEGFYLSVFYPIDISAFGLGEIYVNMIVDRTAEYKAVEDYFEGQRNDLVLRLSIVSVIAIILTLLLTTLGLRYFTRKYVVRPIEELNRTAEEIMDGSYKGEVQVDEGSAYAALQGLLRSGQKVLSRMDEELDK